MKEKIRELIAVGADRPPVESGSNVETLDHLLRAFIAYTEDHRPDLSEGTMRAYRLRVRQIREAGGGTLDLQRINYSALEVLQGQLTRKPLAPRSVRACLHLVGAAWKWGRREGITPDHELMAPDVRVVSEPRYTPTQHQVAAVVDQLEGWNRLAVRMLWATGCRIGELGSLTWEQVDLDAGVVTFDGKTGRREVPLHGDLVAELRALDQTTETVLGVRFNTCRVQVPIVIARACKATKQRVWTPHALRRAAVDQLQRAGVDVKTAASLLGHTPQVMLDYYRQVTDRDRRAAVARARLWMAPKVERGEVYHIGGDE
jgi:integrase